MLTTIIDKLERPTLDGNSKNSIQLTRMQDIGGCRAIVPDLKALHELHARLKGSKSVHEIIRTDDYLTPKDSGYGGVHLVYSCFSGSDDENEWKKTKVEVQLRTELQHAWATSLEIIDTLEGIKLKTSNVGHARWRRFFLLAGRLVAHQERACLISEAELPQVIEEFRELELELDVRKKLTHYSFAIRTTTDKKKLPKRVLAHQGMYLVKLYRPKMVEGKVSLDLNLETFGPQNMGAALRELAESESDEAVMISVLVSAGDVRNLRRAYPNYFGSTTKFREFIQYFLGDKAQ